MTATPARAQLPVVHAVLFYSPSCGHCHKVMTEDLPPLVERYQDQLQILAVNTQTLAGQQLFLDAMTAFGVPEPYGVPTLIAGEAVLRGSTEIPDRFPAIVASGLDAGGLGWPAIPGLAELLPAEGQPEGNPGATAPEPVEPSAPEGEATLAVRFAQDPVGNSLSVLVLVGMLVSLALCLYAWARPPAGFQTWSPDWIPVLAGIGLGVAFYLAFVEVNQLEAVCGPVGDCNTVQSSPYALLFGLLPVGVLGLAGFGLILLSWALWRYGPAGWQARASLALWGLSLAATLFSIYLTFLEPFVIGATCAWCLTSAVVATLLLWTATPLAIRTRLSSHIHRRAARAA
jgi:uncharacterized membrane protein